MAFLIFCHSSQLLGVSVNSVVRIGGRAPRPTHDCLRSSCGIHRNKGMSSGMRGPTNSFSRGMLFPFLVVERSKTITTSDLAQMNVIKLGRLLDGKAALLTALV